MKRHHAPDAGRRYMIANLRNKPRDTYPPVMIFFIIFGLIFSASMAVILIHYLAKLVFQ